MNIDDLIKYLERMKAKGAAYVDFGPMEFFDLDSKKIGLIR